MCTSPAVVAFLHWSTTKAIRFSISAIVAIGVASLVSPVHAQTGAYTLSGSSTNLTTLAENASSTDESGIFVCNSGSLTVGTVNIVTSGTPSSVNNSSQYGINAGILAGTSSGANSTGTITITGTANSIVTSGDGANGLFATNNGSSITMNGGSITTTGNLAHGVDATYGGAITLNNVNITTYGGGCLATDFGGGTVTATGGTMLAANTTLNSHVPDIYSTGTISVTGATITSLGDCGGVIDGANSILLTNTSLTGMVEGIRIWETAGGSAQRPRRAAARQRPRRAAARAPARAAAARLAAQAVVRAAAARVGARRL